MHDKFEREAIRRITRAEKNLVTDVTGNAAQLAILAATAILEHPEQADENVIRARAIIRAMNKQKIDLHELLYGLPEPPKAEPVNAHVRSEAAGCERVGKSDHLAHYEDRNGKGE